MSDDGQYLARLQDYYARHRVLPSYSLIGKLTGLSSKASVAEMVHRLKEEGFLDSAPDKRLRPGRRFFERSVAEHVQAGLPSSATDQVPETGSIDEYLITKPSKTVLIKVKGDSMRDDGILDGDVVVVEKRTSADVGDIVVAAVDNEFTLKRFARKKGRVVLRAANYSYPDIRPKNNAEIFGVIVGLIRRY